MKTNRSNPKLAITVLSLVLGAVGLNIGMAPQAGDAVPTLTTMLIGLGLFLLALWLWTKRRSGVGREDIGQLVAAGALVVALVGVSLTSVGTGAGNMMQNDGYNVTGGLMALIGGLIVGTYLGAKYGYLQAKNKGGR